MCLCAFVCVSLSCQPLVHLGALEDPQELEASLQAVKVVGQGLERGKMLVLVQQKSTVSRVWTHP